MKKSWYIVEAFSSMCGSPPTKRIKEGLTKQTATKLCNQHKRKATKGYIYWIDFDWI